MLRILFILLLFHSFHLHSQDMNRHRWKNRIIIIQSTDHQSSIHQQQLKEFSNAFSALQERKLILYEVVNGKYRLTNFQKDAPQSLWKTITHQFPKASTEHSSFSIMLIGLDGGTKLEQHTILKKEELFRIIDSMPMRLQELRNKG